MDIMTARYLNLVFAYLQCQNSTKETNTYRHVRLCVVSARGVHPSYGAKERTNFGGCKYPGSTNKYTKHGQLIIRKIIKITATTCHILRQKYIQFDSWYSVCLSFK